MSKFARTLSRRIMAVALSVAMITSNMTVYANEVSDAEPQVETVAAEETDVDETEVKETEAKETNVKETSLTQEKVTSDNEDEDAASEDADNKASQKVDEDNKTSENIEEEVSEKKNPEKKEKEKKTSDVDNKETATVADNTDIDFKSATSDTDLTTYQAQGITIGTSFAGAGNNHGIKASNNDDNATVKLNLQADKTATIIVETCIYNDGDKNISGEENKAKMNYSFDTSSGAISRNVPSSGKDDPNYVLENASGEVTLSFTLAHIYIHSIKVQYNNGGDEITSVVEAGTINFKTATIDGLKAQGIGVSNMTLDGSHGLQTAAGATTMTLNLKQDKYADISLSFCGYSSGMSAEVTANPESLKIGKGVYGQEGAYNAPKFTILKAQGKVSLTISAGKYIHEMKVTYYDTYTDKYTVTVNAGEHGKVTGYEGVCEAGGTVTLGVTHDNGYAPEIVVKDTSGNAINSVSVSADNSFTMPAQDVKVDVTFTATGAERNITVTENPEHGSAMGTSVKTAPAGTTVQMDTVATAEPADGYELKEWQVTYKEATDTKPVTVNKAGGKYSFTMPDADITITPVFQEEVVKYFTTTYFNKRVKDGLSTAGVTVNDVDGLEIVKASKFKYHGAQHGLDINEATIKLTLTPDKKYDIIVWGCQHGSGNVSYLSGEGEAVAAPKDTANNTNADDPQNENNVDKFTILNVQNEVTLIFSGGQAYIHSIIVTENDGVAKYSVTVTNDGNGTASADKAIVEKDGTVTLTAVPKPGFRLKEWNVVNPTTNKPVITSDESDKNKATFTMPASNVEIQAVFESTGEDPAEIADNNGFYNGLLASEIVDGRKYYFDFSAQLIADSKNLPDTYTEGLFSYSKGSGANAAYHSAQHGYEFKLNNTLTFQVSGDSYIVIGGNNNNDCKQLKATSETGTLKPEVLSTIAGGQGTLAECENRAGNVLVYEYKGGKGSVTLTLASETKAYSKAACVIPKEKSDLPTYTFTFNPTTEGIDTNNYVTPAGSKFCNDYFEVVDGDITGKGGKVELQNNAQSAIKFVTKETSTVSIVAESTNGDNKSNMVLYKFDAAENKWDIVGEIKELIGNTATTVQYKDLAAGTYKAAVPSEDHPHGRGVRISKIDVTEKITPETVTVHVDAPKGVTGLSLVFTCRETQETVSGTVEDAKCVVMLNALYTYDIIVEPTTYVISEGARLKLGAANETLTADHNVTVETVSLRTLSGSIKGLEDDAVSKLKISFEKPKDKLYIPAVTLDKTAKTYTAELENDTEYTIITDGINDYELDYTVSNNSDKIKITSNTVGRDITYIKKPVYEVTIAPKGAELTNLAEAVFTFTNLNEEGYVYTFTGTDDIKLRDGTYSVKVSNSGIYVQQRTSNLTVDGKPVTKEIPFNSNVTEWNFSDEEWTNGENSPSSYQGLELTGITKNKTYALMSNGSKITIPAKGACNIIVTFCYAAAADINGTAISTTSEQTGTHETVTYSYNGTGLVVISATGTTYIEKISIKEVVQYKEEITVGAQDCDYETISDALDAVRKMDRKDGTDTKPVTISIEPGDYEEMLTIDVANVTLKNASAAPSIDLRNKGVDIDPNAVRITSYYGVGYDYYSMGSDYKWNAETLAINKANGSATCVNPPGGGTASFWNATVVITASNVSAEGIIFENSFNQYISKKAAEDVLVKQGGAKEGGVPRASMAARDTTVQQKEYVERAAALAIANGCSKVSFDNCKIIGRQDTLFGGTGATAAFYNCSIYGGTDYIMGPMTAVFAKCDLVFNTNDQSKATNNDVGYITAAQQASGRGYLMYNCHVTSTIPGVDTASQYTSKPGFFGRPWTSDTGEAVFYKTVIDEVDSAWQEGGALYDKLKDEYKTHTVKSLIMPEGWNSSLSGESALSKEFGTYEVSEINNQSYRVSWAETCADDANPYENDAAAIKAFLGDWKAFDGKNMDIVLPSDTTIAAPAAPKAIVSPEAEIDGAAVKVVKEATVVLAAETGAKVYYNINADSAPTETTGTLYTKAIEIKDDVIKDNKVIIKAIAVKYGKESSVETFTYTVTEAKTPDAPVLTPATNATVLLGSRVMMSAEQGAAIYYNINSVAAPTDRSTPYTGKLGVELTLDDINKTDSTVKIQAVAVMNGKTSAPATVTYKVTVNAPVADHRSGYQFPDGGGTVILTADEDVTILYTMGTNPGDPKATGALTYSKRDGITVTQDTTIKAVAKRGSEYSEVVTYSYKVPLSMPTADPEDNSKLPYGGQNVKLFADEGATIYYVMGDNANPDDLTDTSKRQTYNAANGIDVTTETTIYAIAAKDDRYSAIGTFTYTIASADELTEPVAEPGKKNGSVEVEKGTFVKLSTHEKNAEIWYTMGSAPADPTDENAAGRTKYDDSSKGIKITEAAKIMAVVKRGTNYSEVVTFTYRIKANPLYAIPEAGEVEKGDRIQLKSDIEDSFIYYVTGDADLADNDNAYADPGIEVTDIIIKDGKVTIKAIAKDAEGNELCEAKTFEYTVKTSGGSAGDDYTVVTEDTTKDEGIEIVGLAESYDYTGAAITPDFKVIDRNLTKKAADDSIEYKELTPGVDYTVKYKNNKKAGDAAVTVVGKGNYAGQEVTGSFTIKEAEFTATETPTDLKGAKIITKIAPVTYNGKPQHPEFTLQLKDDSKTEVIFKYENGAYVQYSGTTLLATPLVVRVALSNNTNKGTAAILVTGSGKTSAKTTFKINPVDLSAATAEQLTVTVADKASYAVKGATPAVTVSYKFDGDTNPTVLRNGKDYTVKYAKNKKAGDTGTVTIVGKGNYAKKDSSGKTFTVEPLNMADTELAAVTACEGLMPSKVKATVVDKNGDMLKASQYTVEVYTDKEGKNLCDASQPLGKGTIYVKVAAKDAKNLTGATAGELPSFSVGADISKAKVKLNFKTKAYTGGPIELSASDFMTIEMKDGTPLTLKPAVDGDMEAGKCYYTIKCYNNINKGTATAVISGYGDCSGTKTIKFKIAAKEMKKYTKTTPQAN